MTLDPYDVREAFDDTYRDEGAYASNPRSAHTALMITRTAEEKRLSAPWSIEIVGHDPTTDSFVSTWRPFPTAIEGAWRPFPGVVLGADEALPVYSDLYQQFSAALPSQKLVRLDTPESYKDFRSARRQKYIDSFDARLRALEDAFANHIADDHAARLDRLVDAFRAHTSDGHGAAVSNLLGETMTGGSRIDLPLPPWAKGKIDCWQDGLEILCTVRFLGPDGPLAATSGEHLAKPAAEVLGAVIDADVDPDDAMDLLPTLVQYAGGERLSKEICGLVPRLVGCHAPTVVRALPACDPTMAAAMALLQRCQGGDSRAQAELPRLASVAGELVGDAYNRLLVGQRRKHRSGESTSGGTGRGGTHGGESTSGGTGRRV